MRMTGGCFCGQVRYEVSAPLGPARSCHCSRCRKAFSGAGSAYAEISPGSLSWTTGQDSLAFYRVQPWLGPLLLSQLWHDAVRHARRRGARGNPWAA